MVLSNQRIRSFFLRPQTQLSVIPPVIVDGSFVTAKEEPNDIDLILVLDKDNDFSADLSPYEYNVVSKRRVKKRYPFDVLVAREGAPELDAYVEGFQQVKEQPALRKGLVKVNRDFE